MYLRALRQLGDAYQNALAAGLDAKAAAFYGQSLWTGDDPIACIRNGGAFSVQYSEPVGQSDWSRPNARFYCRMPIALPGNAAPSINVNTAVQSTVSPQISPALVQQQSPSGSPVNAGTQQTSPAAQSSSSGNASYQEFLDAQAAREEAFLDTIAESMATSNPAPYYGGSPAYALDAGGVEAGTPEIAAPSKLAQYTPWIVFASAVAGLAAVLQRNRRNVRTQRG